MKRLAAAAMVLLPLVALAEYHVGQRAFRRGDLQTAYKEFRSAAEGGDAQAARVLGMLLSHDTEIAGGQKLAANQEESAKWYRVGAENGDAISADLLGARLAVGRGVKQDTAEALKWFRTAGREVDEMLSKVEHFPPEDREDIAAWFLAFSPIHKHELRRLKPVGRTGRGWLRLHAKGSRVEVVGDPPPEIAAAMNDYGRRLLEITPPPPGAIRQEVKSEREFIFQ
jgi:hypothetical protein